MLWIADVNFCGCWVMSCSVISWRCPGRLDSPVHTYTPCKGSTTALSDRGCSCGEAICCSNRKPRNLQFATPNCQSRESPRDQNPSSEEFLWSNPRLFNCSCIVEAWVRALKFGNLKFQVCMSRWLTGKLPCLQPTTGSRIQT